MPLCTPTTAALTCGIRVGRDGFSRACGAGMIRGSMHVHELVRAWECDSIELSPITAKRETISNLHPELLFSPSGNQSFIPMLGIFRSGPLLTTQKVTSGMCVEYNLAISTLETTSTAVDCRRAGRTFVRKAAIVGSARPCVSKTGEKSARPCLKSDYNLCFLSFDFQRI